MISTFRKLPPIFMFVSCSLAFAQQGPGPSSFSQPGSSISYEAIPLFHKDTSKAFVNIHYRLREDFFIILRNNENPSESPFLGRGELAVELLNENGTSAAREIRQIRLTKDSLPKEDAEPSDLQGMIPLTVPEGTYTIVFSVEDKQSERKFFDRSKKVTTRKPARSGLDISVPIFVHLSKDSGGTVYQALNRGTDVLFGNSGGALFTACGLSGRQTLTIAYKLTHKPDFEGLDPQEFSGTDGAVSSGIAAIAGAKETSRSPIVYRVEPAADQWRTVFVSLPLERLLPGQSKLWIEFTNGQQKKDFTINFRVNWLARPFSFSNFDLAVDALQHIVKEEEMNEFRTLSTAHNVKAFFNYWKTKDPDTTTAYNELMTEYYRRVDMAIRQYSTTRENDGYKTDRGRIFILYGAPTNTQRVFSPDNAPREIWTYSSLKRRFIFEDSRKNGLFMLIGSETL